MRTFGAFDQARTMEHANVEVEVARIDAEPLRELAVRQRFRMRAELLEHAEPERMTKRLQLFRTIDGQRLEHIPISTRSLG